MPKDGVNKIRDIKASYIPDKQEILNQEILFSKVLDRFHPHQIHSPISLFIKNFKYEKLSIQTKTQQEQVIRLFLLLMQMEKMEEDKEMSPDYIKNILQIVKGQELQSFKKQINFMRGYIQKIIVDNSFKIPQQHLTLQKKGKLTHKHVIREAYLTTEKFGQIKNSNVQKLFKPQNFADMDVFIETKTQIHEIKQKETEKTKNKIAFDKVLKWSDVKDCNFRLRLKDKFNKRQRAIYTKTLQEAQMLKNNAISQRMFKENPDRGKQIKTFNNIWKIKQAEYFYQCYIKRLFQGDYNEKMTKFNLNVQEGTKNYIKLYHPNLYDSGYDPMNTYNFTDNQHLEIQNKKKHSQDDVDNKNFATRIPFQNVEQIDDDEISQQKKNLKLQSPFTKLVQRQAPNPVIMKDFVGSFEESSKPALINADNMTHYQMLAQNNLLILNFNKILVDNVFFQKGIHLNESEIDNLILRIECLVDKGNASDFSMVFVEESNEAFLALNIDCSFKVDLKNLQNIRFKIINKMSQDELLHDSIIDLQSKLNSFQLESMYFHQFSFDYKGIRLNAVINFLIVSIPRNLETSHLVLKRDLIEANFEKFGELLQKINNYIDFHKHFFPPKFIESKFKTQNVDFFYYFNYSLPRNNDFVRHQENMFFNSFKNNSLQESVRLLKNLLEIQQSFEQLIPKTYQAIDDKIKKGLNDFYDILIKVSNLISNQERLLLVDSLNEFENQFYINYTWLSSQSSYQKSLVFLISRETKKIFKDMAHLNDAEKFQAWSVVIKTYLTLENNIKKNQKYQIFFSRHYISLIIKISQLNSPFLKENDVVKLCVNAILNQNLMSQYSLPNNLIHLNSSLVFFKLLFKRLYPNEYYLLCEKMISFDQLFLKCLLNSFSDILDSINLNMFIDFKNTLKLIFLAQGSTTGILSSVNDLGISFHFFIDILFFIEALRKKSEFLSKVEAPLFLENIVKSLQDSFRDFPSVISQILNSIDYLNQNDYLREEYFYFRQVLDKTLKEKIHHFQNFQVNIKSLKIQKEKIKEMIKKEMMKNSFFTQRAQVVFVNDKTFNPEEDTDGLHNDIFNSLLQEDIFFEIAENFEGEDDYDFEGIEKKQIPKFDNCILFLNNVDQKLIKDAATNPNSNQSLHNILTFGNGEFQKLITQGSDAIKNELYIDLSFLQNTEQVSLVKLIIAMILSFSDNNDEVLELLQFLVSQLTSIYYENTKQYFDQILAFVLNEVNSFLPIALYDEFEKNTIQNDQNDLYCQVKAATIVLPDCEIDITHICAKHFIANTFKAKRPCIRFDRNFCEDLEEVFKDLLEKKMLEEEFERFELFLSVVNQQVPQSVNVAFKISFEEQISIFAQYKETIHFNQNFGVKNLVDAPLLEKKFFESPFCFYEVFNSLKSPFYFTTQKFTIKFYSLKEQFLTVDLKFVDKDHRNLTNLLTWTYFTPKNVEMLKFKQNQINLEVPLSYFFLDIGEFSRGVSLVLLEKLDPADIFKFVQLNNDRKSVTNANSKDIDFSAHIYELKDYDALSQDGSFTLHFVYKP